MTTKKLWNPYHFSIHLVLKYLVVILVAVIGIAKSIPVYADVTGKTSGIVVGNTFKDCSDCPEMVTIPAGSFEMGSRYDDSDNNNAGEKPVHNVTVKAFALGKTEVTKGQWRSVFGFNAGEFNGCGDDDCPMGIVLWSDVQEFIQRLSAKTGMQYRLPSESEWEYACRAGGQNEYCGSDSIDSVAWHKGNSGKTTHPVSRKNPNVFGLYDMSGNVMELLEDSYHYGYKGAPTDGSAWQGDGDFRVLRGGGWNSWPRDGRADARTAYNVHSKEITDLPYGGKVGFRVARVSASADSAIQGRVDDLKNIVVPPLLSQERFPETATPRANSDLSAEENQLDNCQRLEKQNIIEQAIAACLPLVWSKNSKIRKQSSGLFADAVSTKNRRLVTNQPKSLPILPDPYIVHGGCPGEGCMFGMWSAEGTIQIFEQPGSKQVIGQLVRGERVAALLGELRVHPLNGVVVGKIDQLRLGESVYLLDYKGEGQSNMWIRGRVVLDPRWGGNCRPVPTCEHAIPFPKEKKGLRKGQEVQAVSEWWVKIQRRNGQTGWVLLDTGSSFISQTGPYYDPETDNIPDPFDGMPMATASKDALPIFRSPLDCAHAGEGACQFKYSLGAYTPGIINSVLDHSLKMNGSGPWWQYGKLSEGSGDGVIVTFDGKRFDGARKRSDETCVVRSVKMEQVGAAMMTADLINSSGCGDGYISYDEHPGYDYRASEGTPVKAVAEGRIIDLNGERCIKTNIKGTCNDWGYVGIDHGNGYVTQYGHLSDISVSAGAKVLQGEPIGLSGNKAPATVHLGDHLHFEVLKLVGGVYYVVDPYGWSGSGVDPLYSAAIVPPKKLWIEPLPANAGR